MSVKKFRVAVNGKNYDVEVEELSGYPSEMMAKSSPVGSSRGSNVAQSSNGASSSVDAPLAGTVLRVDAKEGQVVKEGDRLLVIEAMKMENDIVSPKSGKIEKILVSQGDQVFSGQALVRIS